MFTCCCNLVAISLLAIVADAMPEKKHQPDVVVSNIVKVVEKSSSGVKEMKMGMEVPQTGSISTQVFDFVHGEPAKQLTVTLLLYKNGRDATEVMKGKTNENGRIEFVRDKDNAADVERMPPGIYGLRYETTIYFVKRDIKCLPIYHNIELRFPIKPMHKNTHVRVVLTEDSYTAYKPQMTEIDGNAHLFGNDS